MGLSSPGQGPDSAVGRAAVRAINDIGHETRTITVDELMEAEGLFKALAQMGADYAQGRRVTCPQTGGGMDRAPRLARHRQQRGASGHPGTGAPWTRMQRIVSDWRRLEPPAHGGRPGRAVGQPYADGYGGNMCHWGQRCSHGNPWVWPHPTTWKTGRPGYFVGGWPPVQAPTARQNAMS